MKDIHQILKTRPTYVEVDFDALRHNFNQIKDHVGDKKILCIVKGNGYGHGAVEVSRVYEKLGANYLGVAIAEEGVELREAGIKIPILVMGGLALNQIDLCIQRGLTITAPSDEKLLYINKTAGEMKKIAKVHLKVDTGMGRIGVNFARVNKFYKIMKECENCEFEGIYSHFAASDTDGDFTKTQIERFENVISKFEEEGFSFKIKHLANSAGLLNYPESRFDMVRPGIILYGLHEGFTIPEEIDLKPVMSWKTQVVYFKFLEKNTPISYGLLYKNSEDTHIVTIPVGYADGYQRSLSNGGHVTINDKKYPVVGRICMDQIMIDIGIDGEAYKGDEVILVGSSESQNITFYDLSRWGNTSVHELLAQISYRVPRIYLDS
ncbi:MAG: alanine racemase [Candidatus Paceibacteria bacterium]|jgi:alanine racemase